jgi:hypothetical protein
VGGDHVGGGLDQRHGQRLAGRVVPQLVGVERHDPGGPQPGGVLGGSGHHRVVAEHGRRIVHDLDLTYPDQILLAAVQLGGGVVIRMVVNGHDPREPFEGVVRHDVVGHVGVVA